MREDEIRAKQIQSLGKPINTPKVEVALPHGDSRIVEIRWVEWKPDGTLYVCVSVEDPNE